MKDYIRKIKNRYIDEANITTEKELPENVKLQDKFVTWIFNSNIHVVKLEIMTKAVILYYPINYNNNKNILSVIVNPITLQSSAYIGKINVIDINNDTDALVLEFGKYKFEMGMSVATSNGKDKINLNIINCRIMILRDVFIFQPDPIYIKINKSLTDIFPESYYTNKLDHENNFMYETYHPKTLIYVIKYKSTSGKYKVTFLVGAGANSTEPTGMNYRKSRFDDYIRVYSKELADKCSFIYPMYWYSANKQFKKYKIVAL